MVRDVRKAKISIRIGSRVDRISSASLPTIVFSLCFNNLACTKRYHKSYSLTLGNVLKRV